MNAVEIAKGELIPLLDVLVVCPLTIAAAS